MKVKANSVEETFKPVTVAITCESEQELGALFAIFNHTELSSAMRKSGLKPLNINEEIKIANGGTPNYRKFHDDQLTKIMA